MSEAIHNYERLKCEDLINGLGGVIASKIVEDEHGTISDIHVLISKDRHPKQISKDVQTVLATNLNRKVDHRCISIAQTGIQQIPEDCRVYFKSVNIRISDGEIFVEVELSKNKEIFSSSAHGINTRNNADQLTVNATLECLKKMINTDEMLMIEDIDVVYLAKTPVVMVAVNLVNRFSEDILVGSAMLRDDRKESLVRAALDAVNRKISILI